MYQLIFLIRLRVPEQTPENLNILLLPKQMNRCHVGDICPFDIGHRSVTAPGHPLLGRLADTDCSLKTFPPSLVYNFRPGQNYYRLQTLKIATTSRRLRPVDLIHDLTCQGRVVSYPQAQAQGPFAAHDPHHLSGFGTGCNVRR